jgi:hypothetical protein
MSQTLVRTTAGSTTPILERYVQQNREWQTFVCAKLTTPIERVLRDLYCAARVASKQRNVKEIEPIFKVILARVPSWTDEACAKEFADDAKDIDACIRMAVRAHAIVMALTISRQCKEIIKVPNSQTFFKRVLMDTANEHNVDVFGSQDFAVRKHLRIWIIENIIKHLLALVPVSLFTEEDETEIAATPVLEPPVCVAPLVSKDLVCDEQKSESAPHPLAAAEKKDESAPRLQAAAEKGSEKGETCAASQEIQSDLV